MGRILALLLMCSVASAQTQQYYPLNTVPPSWVDLHQSFNPTAGIILTGINSGTSSNQESIIGTNPCTPSTGNSCHALYIAPVMDPGTSGAVRTMDPVYVNPVYNGNANYNYAGNTQFPMVSVRATFGPNFATNSGIGSAATPIPGVFSDFNPDFPNSSPTPYFGSFQYYGSTSAACNDGITAIGTCSVFNGNISWSGSAGSGGTLYNRGLVLQVGNGHTTGTYNQAIYITGNGNGGATQNNAIYSNSSAPSFFVGTIQTTGLLWSNQYYQNGDIPAPLGVGAQVGFFIDAQNQIDTTTPAGNVTSAWVNEIKAPTLSTTGNALTVTNAATFNVDNCPHTSANVTSITNCFAIRASAGLIGGAGGALINGGTITLNGSSSTNSTNIGTGSTTGAVNIGGGSNAIVLGGGPTLPLTTPASSSAACTTGTVDVDASFVYVCTATNTWKRAALATF